MENGDPASREEKDMNTEELINAWKAEEALCHNLDELEEACDEFGCDMGEIIKQGAETADVTIRCYLLGRAISEVLEEYKW